MLIPKAKPLLVAIPKETNFHIPEGKYRAKIVDVRKKFMEKLSGTTEMLKLMFHVQVPSLQRTINLASAEFKLDLNSGSELRNLLVRLFGKDALVDEFDLERLINVDVEVEIEHVITSRREEYVYPLVKVRDIQKPGKLALVEYKEANQ
jgi:hypothetical protein